VYKGTLKAWNVDRGFGFIKSEGLKRDVFVHISSLKNMSRKPKVGDVIYFEIEKQVDGKEKAVKCRIVGVAAVSASKHVNSRPKKKSTFFINFLSLVLFGCIVLFAYQKVYKTAIIPTASISGDNPVISIFKSSPINEAASYSCSGKTYCSEMSSCAEAKFYQNNCPGTKMDGDGDGIPCERQFCNGW
jgi:cold shock CspA family protein